MNPKTLRADADEMLDVIRYSGSSPQDIERAAQELSDKARAAADAWQDDLIRLHTADAKALTLEFRLEACEKGFSMDALRQRLEVAEYTIVAKERMQRITEDECAELHTRLEAAEKENAILRTRVKYSMLKWLQDHGWITRYPAALAGEEK